jgi:hypothetical protein
VLLLTKQSVSLQRINKNLAKCLPEVDYRANLLRNVRENVDVVFAGIVKDAELAVGASIQIPCLYSRQKHQPSHLDT